MPRIDSITFPIGKELSTFKLSDTSQFSNLNFWNLFPNTNFSTSQYLFNATETSYWETLI
jgi:hypothetical protein